MSHNIDAIRATLRGRNLEQLQRERDYRQHQLAQYRGTIHEGYLADLVEATEQEIHQRHASKAQGVTV